ncbi:Oidioi.mRNA.OKI2018_I69.XSR.g16838.t1.cds [Oikopleura dioica]|uniref:Oidioi.mRNA.OKI2018_I69.XSR.g16838.t1.cds n=1 Tax=Oikopleura dioica TaxID=34765 RepID=A0ABN7SMI4_OIKDI|nr:Oidioi.mRNA.OKI2018_I69.XSR.g16838.t1.cds [Oikopleura dioica]
MLSDILTVKKEYNRARVVSRSASAFSKRSARRNTAHPISDFLQKTSGSGRKTSEANFENDGVLIPYQNRIDLIKNDTVEIRKWDIDKKIQKSFFSDIEIAGSWLLWICLTFGLLCLGNAVIFAFLLSEQLTSLVHAVIVAHYCLVILNIAFLLVANKCLQDVKHDVYLFCSGLALANSFLALGFSYFFFIKSFHSIDYSIGLIMTFVLYCFIFAAAMFLSFISFQVQFVLSRLAASDIEA